MYRSSIPGTSFLWRFVISKFHCILKPFGYLQYEDSNQSSVSVTADIIVWKEREKGMGIVVTFEFFWHLCGQIFVPRGREWKIFQI